jgi:hypothetical protein
MLTFPVPLREFAEWIRFVLKASVSTEAGKRNFNCKEVCIKES